MAVSLHTLQELWLDDKSSQGSGMTVLTNSRSSAQLLQSLLKIRHDYGWEDGLANLGGGGRARKWALEVLRGRFVEDGEAEAVQQMESVSAS